MLAELFEPPVPFEPVPVQEYVPEQVPEETRAQYAARCLTFILQGGPLGALTREQVEQADQAAQRQVCALPMVLEVHHQAQNKTLGDLRHRLAKELDRRRANERAFCALLASCQPPTPDQDLEGPQDGQNRPQDDKDRALRLLRAALVLVMQGDQERPDGGKLAKLTPPSPTRPPGGMANTPGGF